MTVKKVSVQEVSFESKGETLPATLYSDTSVAVIFCPPYPPHGGNRKDPRLVRVARELSSHNVSALCIDYGSYGGGVKEVQNVLDAVSFMQKRTSQLGLLGYSFGAVVASNAAVKARMDGFVAMSILRKIDSVETHLDFDCPKLFVHGKIDDVAPYSEFEQLYREAKEPKEKLVLDVGHFYMEDYPNTMDAVSRRICNFFLEVFSK
jgi:alpha/beta superfamily hydrolase